MFPKLSWLQWVIFLCFLFFFGFAVFGVTRDYYLRHPLVVSGGDTATLQSSHAGTDNAAALGSRMRQVLEDADSLSVDLSSDDLVALGDAADQLFLARQFDAAIPIYQRVVELAPGSADARNDLGLALHYSGRSEEGLSALREATEIAPGFQRAWLSLGFVAFQAGDFASAEQALSQAQSLDPSTDVGEEAARLLNQLSNGTE